MQWPSPKAGQSSREPDDSEEGESDITGMKADGKGA